MFISPRALPLSNSWLGKHACRASKHHPCQAHLVNQELCSALHIDSAQTMTLNQLGIELYLSGTLPTARLFKRGGRVIKPVLLLLLRKIMHINQLSTHLSQLIASHKPTQWQETSCAAGCRRNLLEPHVTSQHASYPTMHVIGVTRTWDKSLPKQPGQPACACRMLCSRGPTTAPRTRVLAAVSAPPAPAPSLPPASRPTPRPLLPSEYTAMSCCCSCPCAAAAVVCPLALAVSAAAPAPASAATPAAAPASA